MLTTLARLFIDLLKIGANSVDAKRLKDYKAPKSASNATFNDFAAVLFEVLKNRGYTRYVHFTRCLETVYCWKVLFFVTTYFFFHNNELMK